MWLRRGPAPEPEARVVCSLSSVLFFTVTVLCFNVLCCSGRFKQSTFTLTSDEWNIITKLQKGKKTNIQSFLYPLWIRIEHRSVSHWVFSNYVLHTWAYSTLCVPGVDILDKFIILPGFHPCINKSMKILSEHILMRANSA